MSYEIPDHKVELDSEHNVERLPPLERFVYQLTRPFRILGAKLSRMDESGWFIRRVEATGILSIAKGSLAFVAAWLTSRRYRQLAYGMPALALFSIVTVAVVSSLQSVGKGYRYWASAQKAWNDGAKDEALLLFEKACQLRPEDKQLRYQRALCTLDSGDVDATIQQMKEIANEGFSLADRWLASVYFHQLTEGQDPDSRETFSSEAGVHLERLLESDPDDVQVAQMQTAHLRMMGRTDDAIDLLTKLPKRTPELTLALAELQLEQGNEVQAQATAQSIIADYENQRAAGEYTTSQASYFAAKACLVAENYVGATTILSSALRAYPDEPLIRQLLGTAVRHLAENVEANSLENVAVKLQLLQAALRLDPKGAEALRMVAKLTRRRDGGYGGTLKALRQTVAGGKSNALSHACLGILSFNSGDLKAAEFHLNLATELGINAAGLLANMVVHEEPSRALELASLAVRIAPENPVPRAVRGQLLMREKRWNAALEDLEFAASKLPENQTIAALLQQLREKVES